MSLLDSIKKIFSTEVVKSELQKVNFDKLPEIIENIETDIKEKQKKIKKQISENIKNFEIDLKDNIKILEQISLDARKEQEKVKIIVQENLHLYISYLNRMIEDLKKAESLEFEEYLRKISQGYDNFNKLSKIAFEKATILIGKELEQTRELVNSLFRETHNNIKNIENDLISQKLITEIKHLSAELKIINKNQEEIKKIIEKTEKEQEKIHENIKEKENDLERFIESREYKEDAREKDKRKKNLSELDREIQITKDKLDLKLLAKKFHSTEKTRKLIQEYMDNFKQALIEDEFLELQNLTNTNLSSLRTKILELTAISLSDIDKRQNELENSISELKSQFEKKTNEINEEERRLGKLKEKHEELKNKIKSKSKELNIELFT